MRTRVAFLPVAALIVGVLPGACAGDPPAPDSSRAVALVERSRVSMGSQLRLSAWTADEARAVRSFERVFDEFDRLDRLLSVWHDDSDVSRINAAAGRAPVAIQAETMETLQAARRVSEWTAGKFDVTFGALAGLWKFDHDQDNQVPSAAAIRARLPLIDFRRLDLDLESSTAFLPVAGMRVHLGGIGKGYAVDRAAALLRSDGFNDFMIQAGGDLYASGRHGDRAWRAGVRDPRGPADRIFAALNLHDETFSTSGDYERFFIRDGRRYHHILDPDTGEPAHGCRSVTIVSAKAVIADGLSTGVFILGPKPGMELIEMLPDVEGVIVTDRNEVLVSSGLTARLERLASPTDAP